METKQEIRFDGGDFEAFCAAEKWCKDAGYSVGSMQRGDPIGILRGDFEIAKWRDLDASERAALDGTIEGDKRNGPVFVRLRGGK